MKHTLKSVSAALAAVLLLCACGAPAASGSSSSSASGAQESAAAPASSAALPSAAPEAAKPVKLSATLPGFATDSLNPQSPIFLKLQELANAQLELNFIPQSAYDEKLSAMIAGNTLPDVIYLTNMSANTTATAIEAGIFWQLDEFIPQYENIAKVPAAGWLRSSVEGKTYGLFRERNVARLGVQYRQDWAEKVGITKAPATIDEFYDMCVKFTKEDPDGNGQNDTLGISFQSSMAAMATIIGWHGAGQGKNYELTDGKIQHVMMNDNYYAGAAFLRKLYSEGLCNQDFISVKQRADNFRASKAGILTSSVEDAVANYAELAKLVPTAKVAVSGPVDAGHGLNAAADTSGYKGYFAFPKTVVKDEARLREILGVFDRMNTAEVNNLLQYGVEGTHYTVESGTAVRTDEQNTKRIADCNDLNGLQTFSITVNPAMPLKADTLQAQINDVLAINDTCARTSPTSGLVSKTSSKSGSELAKILDDAQAKYIMGQISEEQLKAAVAQWRAQGGDAIMQEYNESYQKATAK